LSSKLKRGGNFRGRLSGERLTSKVIITIEQKTNF
jgi:hypothetical protein